MTNSQSCFHCTMMHFFLFFSFSFLVQSLGMAHFVWISPLQCILCTGLIWELIDVNSFCALAAISLLGVLQAFLSHKMGPYK